MWIFKIKLYIAFNVQSICIVFFFNLEGTIDFFCSVKMSLQFLLYSNSRFRQTECKKYFKVS